MTIYNERLIQTGFPAGARVRLAVRGPEPRSKMCHEPRRKLLAMTVTINANSTLRRHCEAKEKIRGEKKIHLPKQSHFLFPAMFLLKAAPVLYFLISPVILYDGSWGHEPGRGLWALIKKKSSALITMLTNYFCVLFYRCMPGRLFRKFILVYLVTHFRSNRLNY